MNIPGCAPLLTSVRHAPLLFRRWTRATDRTDRVCSSPLSADPRLASVQANLLAPSIARRTDYWKREGIFYFLYFNFRSRFVLFVKIIFEQFYSGNLNI